MRDPLVSMPVRRLDYQPPAFLVDRVELDFDIHEGFTRVSSRLHMRRNPAAGQGACEFDGEGLQIEQLKIDGRVLGEGDYRYAHDRLVLLSVPDQFVFEAAVTIDPA